MCFHLDFNPRRKVGKGPTSAVAPGEISHQTGKYQVQRRQEIAKTTQARKLEPFFSPGVFYAVTVLTCFSKFLKN
jgi:hypothetical protein